MEDIEIARNVSLKKIEEIAKNLEIKEENIETYGKYKAKISLEEYEELKNKEDGKLILVTAINPTPLGEGKTTIAIGLADGLKQIEKINTGFKGTFFRTSIWNKRWSNRWRLLSSCTNGRYKSSFYRRHSRNNISK